MTHSDDSATTELPAASAVPTLDDWLTPDAAGAPSSADSEATGVEEASEADSWSAEAAADRLDRDELILAAAPSNVSPDELDAALASPPPSARSLQLTRLLGVGLVVAAAFLGGIALGQRTDSASPAAAGAGQFPRGAGQGFPGGFPGANGGQDTGAAGGEAPQGTRGEGGSDAQGTSDTGTTTSKTTSGTVRLVDGSVIYLADADGNLTRVEVTDDTQITTSSEAKLGDIDTGDSVTVTGTTTTDGVTATDVAVAQ